jgi:hypothetical protein
MGVGMHFPTFLGLVLALFAVVGVFIEIRQQLRLLDHDRRLCHRHFIDH